jgi:hypothetical protein
MTPSRTTFPYPVLTILLFYFLPVSIWIFYTYYTAPLSYSWAVAIIGISIVCMGSALLYTLMRTSQEEEVVAQTSELPAETQDAPIEELESSFQNEKEFFLKQIEDIQQQMQRLKEILSHTENELNGAREENALLIEKLKTIQEEHAQKATEKIQRIDELKQQLEQKQQVTHQLENQIQDLRYEIKTLLQLTEDYASFENDPLHSPFLLEKDDQEEIFSTGQVKNEEEARRLLSKCLNIAQKIHSNYQPSLKSISHDPYVYDLRRLKDALKSEEGAIILVYSPKEEKVLFANKAAKAFLGWGSDKFAKDFDEIVGADFLKWKAQISELIIKSEVSFLMECKNKRGDAAALRAMAATIPTGAFRSLVVAVLFN